jgi:hypothetical protein
LKTHFAVEDASFLIFDPFLLTSWVLPRSENEAQQMASEAASRAREAGKKEGRSHGLPSSKLLTIATTGIIVSDGFDQIVRSKTKLALLTWAKRVRSLWDFRSAGLRTNLVD